MTAYSLLELGGIPTTEINIPTYSPISGAGNTCTVFAVDEDSFVNIYAASNAANSTGWLEAVVYDASGATTFYRSAIIDSITQYFQINYAIPLGGGRFLLFTYDSYVGQYYPPFVFRAVNLKLNNATPINIPLNFADVSNPCAALLEKVFYDAQRNVLIAAFYSGGSSGGNTFESSYSIDPVTGYLTPLNYGFVGTTSGSYDPLVNAPNLSPYDSNYAQLSNGVSAAWNYQQNVLYFGDYNCDIGNSASECGPPNGAQVTYRNVFELYYPPSIFSNMTGWIDSTIPYVIGLPGNVPNNNGGFMLYANGIVYTGWLLYANNWVQFYAGVLTRKHFFALINGAGSSSGPLVVTVNRSLFPSGNTLYRSGWNTVNHARPISLTGNYKS